jgi:pyroglutamyl-peptidase
MDDSRTALVIEAEPRSGATMPVVLLTGFGAFPGAPSNPSADIIRLLGGAPTARLARLGIRLERHVLPVVFASVPERLATLMEDLRPSAVLHVGLAGRRRSLCVEARACNFVSQLHPDARRQVAVSRSIAPGGSPARRARVPSVRMVQALRAAGARSRISIDAGTYVCNQTLYMTLGADIALAGFIHVPRPRGRRPLSASKTPPRPTLASMARAIEAALIVLATELRRAVERERHVNFSQRG